MQPAFLLDFDATMTLGYLDTRHAVRQHCKKTQPVGGGVSPLLDQQTVIIPESDLYRLIIKSKLESAERFEEWVFEEVLPTIRQTGGYQQEQPQFPIPKSLPEALRFAADLQEKMELDAPKVAYVEEVVDHLLFTTLTREIPMLFSLNSNMHQ